MKKSKTAVGIDVGTNSIKMAVVRKERDGIRILRAVAVPIPLDVAGSRDRRTQFVSESMGTLLADSDARKNPVVIATPGQAVFIRYVKLPPVAPGKLDQIVGYEAQQQVPFPLDGVIWDYQRLPSRTPAETNIVLVAIKRELIGQSLEQLAVHHVEPEVIDHGPLAFYNCAKYVGELPDDQVTILLDVGAKATDLSIERDGQLCWTRSVPTGGNDLTEAIARALNIDTVAAESAKLEQGAISEQGAGAEGDQGAAIQEAIRPVLEELLSEVQRSVGYFRSQLEGGRVDRVLLCGGTGRLPGFDALLEGRLGVEVLHADVLGRLGTTPDVMSGLDGAGDMEVAVGLALRVLVPCKLTINLLPPELIQRQQMRRKRPYLVASAVLFALIGASSSVFTYQDYDVLDQEYQRVHSRLTSITKFEPDVKKEKDTQSKFESELTVLRSMSGQRTFWPEVLLELGRVLPDDTWLEAVRATGVRRAYQPGDPPPGRRGLAINGVTTSFDSLTNVMDRLNGSPMFEKLELENSETVTVEVVDPGSEDAAVRRERVPERGRGGRNPARSGGTPNRRTKAAPRFERLYKFDIRLVIVEDAV